MRRPAHGRMDRDMPHRMALFMERESNPYMGQVQAEAAAEAEARGLLLECFFADNRFLQIQQLYASIRAARDRPDGIAVFPAHDDSLGRVARAALESGMDWVSLHRRAGDLDALQRQFPRSAVTLVGPDQVEIGRLQGRLARRYALGGRILYVQGSQSHASAAQRLQGFREVIDARREIVGILDGNWTAEDAQLGVQRWMHVMMPSIGRIDAVVCQNDAMAEGARAALEETTAPVARFDAAAVPIIGCDGLRQQGRRFVDEGKLSATVVIEDVGRHAVRAVSDRLRGLTPVAEIILRPSAYPSLPGEADDTRETLRPVRSA
jgi:ABC-type sugar transport system substrate-binding protein